MTQDIINLVNKMGKEEKVRDGIQFLRVDGGATITDLYTADEKTRTVVRLTRIMNLMIKT